jgi:sugar phosphate isomerase/epimerase
VQDKNDTQDRIDELNFKLYSSLIPTLRECNVTVCLENLPTWYTDGKGFRMIYEGHCCNPYNAVAEIDMLNDIAGKECFGLCLDTGHLNITRTPVTKYISVLGDRIKCLHIHDNNGADDLHLMPYSQAAKGAVDWEEFITGLREIGYRGDLSFETFMVMRTFPAALHEPVMKLIAAEAAYFRNRILAE